MIDKLTYDEVQTVSNELKNLAKKIEKLIEGKGSSQLEDFVATVEGYFKIKRAFIALFLYKYIV